MKLNPIDFEDSLYDQSINGHAYWRQCNKRYKPESHDLSYDTTVHANDVWFMHTDYVCEFYSRLDPNGPPISIVLAHSDNCTNDSLVYNKPKCVVKVFGPNNTSLHSDSIAIPLGLGPPPPQGHGAPLGPDIQKVDTRQVREKLLYVNFRPYTCPSVRSPLWNKYKSLQSDLITVEEPSQDQQTFAPYLNSLIQHKFCLCPRGNGIDTHRMWECLYARTVPIVMYEDAHRNWTDLPILFIRDWNEVTEEFLTVKYEEMCKNTYDYSKLNVSWWGNQFRAYS